jgi:hypothetical protein
MLQIATDYEKFVHDGNTIVSAIGLIGGDKDSPRWANNGNLQEDNVLAEAATQPCRTEQDFIQTIQSLDKELLSALPQGYSLVTQATNEYTQEYLMSCGSNALRFGCSSEIQAWTGDIITAPSPYTTLRTAGAHVHFSYEEPCTYRTMEIIKTMDYLLGLWSLLHDPDRTRRRMYGTAGSCRIKDYGGEYRALSNFWIDSPELISEVYRRTNAAVRFSEQLLPELQAVLAPELLRTAINEYRVPVAEAIVPVINDILEEE